MSVNFNDLPRHLQDALMAEAIEEAQNRFETELKEQSLEIVLQSHIERAYPLDKYPEFKTSEQAYRYYIDYYGNPPDQIANLERHGIVLLRWQLEFAKAARDADQSGLPNEIGVGGARGPGKTFSIFAVAALDDCVRMPGLSVLYLRKAQKAGKEQLSKLIKSVLGRVESVNNKRSLKKKVGHLQYNYVESPTPTIHFNNGSKIVVGHYQTEAEALNYQGVEYDLVIIEETTHLSKSAYVIIGLSTRTDNPQWRPRTYNSTNPLGKGHGWYKKYFVDPQRYEHVTNEDDAMIRFIAATVADNHFVDPDYKGRLNKLTGVKKRAWLDGDWDVSAGAYFENFRHDVHVIRTLDGVLFKDLTSIPDGWDVWLSMDSGFRHWNMIYVHCEDHDGNKYTIKEFAHRKMQPEQIAPDILNYLKQIGYQDVEVICFAGGDAFIIRAGQPNTLAQTYYDLGLPLTPAWTPPGSRVEGARCVSQLLGDPDYHPETNPTIQASWFISDECTRLIDCLSTLEPDPNNAEDVAKVNADVNGEGGDDAYDAVRYGLYVPHLTQIA